ncbi:MAG TPA: hypothetical protein VH722_10925 [Alphaproteobacteria bacterium]|nr:hypothetical protein [Alphaproteobacteria bacterium]
MKLALILPMAGLAMLTACAGGPTNGQVQLAQEQHTCAQMGIDPGSQAFGQCVGNLDATMFETHYSAGR